MKPEHHSALAQEQRVQARSRQLLPDKRTLEAHLEGKHPLILQPELSA